MILIPPSVIIRARLYMLSYILNFELSTYSFYFSELRMTTSIRIYIFRYFFFTVILLFPLYYAVLEVAKLVQAIGHAF